MSLPPQPDMTKVNAAVKALELRRRAQGPPPSQVRPPAQDAAIRKPLTSHGTPCRGFDCRHFLNNHD